jgi:NAD(P)-dependent dehydrogenase (short-subunit alcohol dehydrogenase family)
VVVVATDAPDLALAVARDGATVVIVAPTPAAEERAGGLAGDIERAGGRVAVFSGDASTDEGRAGLTEMLDELFG